MQGAEWKGSRDVIEWDNWETVPITVMIPSNVYFFHFFLWSLAVSRDVFRRFSQSRFQNPYSETTDDDARYSLRKFARYISICVIRKINAP